MAAPTTTTTNLSISMPQRLKDAMTKRMADQGFENASEYVRHLIRDDARRAAEQQLDHMLLAADREEGTIVVDDEYWERKRAELTAQALARKAKRS